MRRLLAPLAAVAAAVGAYRLLARRRRATPVGPEPAAPDARAEELRRKLAEARGAVGDEADWSSGEVTVDQAEPAPPDPDERRRRVHAEGRSTAERMRSPAD